jgi:hypothetical protein
LLGKDKKPSEGEHGTWWASRIVVSVTSTRFCLGSHSLHKYSTPLVSRMYFAVSGFSGAGARAAAAAAAAAVSAATGSAVSGLFIATGASLRYFDRSPSTTSSAKCLVSLENAGPAFAAPLTARLLLAAAATLAASTASAR